jgi:hypothetical protein
VTSVKEEPLKGSRPRFNGHAGSQANSGAQKLSEADLSGTALGTFFKWLGIRTVRKSDNVAIFQMRI